MKTSCGFVESSIYLRLWDIRGDQEIKQYKPPTPNSSFTSVATSLSGRLLLASSDDSTIHMWDITGTHLGNLGGHENRITQVATILEFLYFDFWRRRLLPSLLVC